MKSGFVASRTVIVMLVLMLGFSVILFHRGTSLCPTPPSPPKVAIHEKPIYLREIQTDKNSQKLNELLLDLLRQQSVLLNEQRRKIGQMDCEKVRNKETNEAGGWCRESSKEDGGQHMTDMKLVAALSRFFANKFVGSFGDGPGAYKRELLKLGDVKGYDAYDGAPYCEDTSEGRVKFMDLTVPQYGIRMYDWVLSLEVAEHIPKEYESVYMGNLVRHAREGIVMSWAVPEQGGLAHINLQPLDYVVDLLNHYGFKHDVKSSVLLQDASSFQWLRQNINVFRRHNLTILKPLEQWFT